MPRMYMAGLLQKEVDYRPSAADSATLRAAALTAREAAHRLKGVYLFGTLVVAQAEDAREAQGVAALVPLRLLHQIERDLQHYLRLDDADAPVRELLHRVRAEPLRQLGQLGVRQPRVSLADVQKLRVFL